MRKGYNSKQSQLEANRRYLRSKPGALEKKIKNSILSNAKSFMRLGSPLEVIDFLDRIRSSRTEETLGKSLPKRYPINLYAEIFHHGTDLELGKFKSIIERLPEEDKELLRYRFKENLSYSQISKRNGYSSVTIMNRINAILEKIRDEAN